MLHDAALAEKGKIEKLAESLSVESRGLDEINLSTGNIDIIKAKAIELLEGGVLSKKVWSYTKEIRYYS